MAATLIDQATEYLRTIGNKAPDAKSEFEVAHVEEIAGLKIPKGAGAEQVEYIIGLLNEYVTDTNENKPLSIAIFGPPGSGKSTFVRNISNKVKGLHLVRTANMTQVNHSEELVDAFKNALLSMRGNENIPVVFFDEFDTMRNGTPLGWLGWFLAPMEDGILLAQGQELEIGKAVFIFAGGTAETMDEFNERSMQNQEAYRACKVPDFISRLRGAIDIGGINGHGDGRIISRTLALGYSLDSEDAKRLHQENRLEPILKNGFFVHGVRSLKTFLKAELSDVGAPKLPEIVRRRHFSRGVFDGLTVGISASLDGDGSVQLSTTLTERLSQSGATIAYAGAFFPQGTLDTIRGIAEAAPPDLIVEEKPKPRIVNFLGYPAGLKAPKSAQENIFEVKSLNTISEEELKSLGAPTASFFEAIPSDDSEYKIVHHAVWAISQYRLRVRVIQDIRALIVYGGKDDGKSWGRMSGIAEEVMIALALQKPIYVLGGVGGAAQAVGQLLGLHDAPVAMDRLLVSERGDALISWLKENGIDFSIPGIAKSPMDANSMRRFIFDHGLNTDEWPENGLTADENRSLFSNEMSNGADGAVNLILKGLGNIDWKLN